MLVCLSLGQVCWRRLARPMLWWYSKRSSGTELFATAQTPLPITSLTELNHSMTETFQTFWVCQTDFLDAPHQFPFVGLLQLLLHKLRESLGSVPGRNTKPRRCLRFSIHTSHVRNQPRRHVAID